MGKGCEEMIDTMTIRIVLTKSIVRDLLEQINRYLKLHNLGKLHKDKRIENWRYYTEKLNNRGFLELALNKPERQYFLEIKLQPIRLLIKNECVSLAEFEQYIKIEEAFNSYLEEILCFENNMLIGLLQLMKFRDWKVSRIDYAFNYYTPYLETYMNLLHHGNIPQGFTKHNYEDSLYLTSKAANINFYDKHSQLSKKSYLALSDIKEAWHILRFEVQCKNKDVQRLKKKFDLEDTNVKEFWNANIAEYVLKNRIQQS